MSEKLHFIGCDTPYNKATTVIVGAPFDGTVSYRPGSRFATNAIRLDSSGLETYSPYQDADILEKNIADIGDISIPFGNTPKTLDLIYSKIKTIVDDAKRPFMIGGEHLVSYPAIKAVFEKYPDLKVIHIDAHTDLRDTYMGEHLSHATVLKRVHDLLGPKTIFQFGIRSGLKEEFEFAQNHHYIEKFTAHSINDIVPLLSDSPIYVTLDLDVLDPSVMPGTGTPEAGGLSYHELMDLLYALKKLNIVGCDVVELSPDYDPSGVSTAITSKIIRELLLIVER